MSCSALMNGNNLIDQIRGTNKQKAHVPLSAIAQTQHFLKDGSCGVFKTRDFRG